MTACPCGGIGRRVGLKIQSGLSLGASSSLAKGSYKKLTEMWALFIRAYSSHKARQRPGNHRNVGFLI